MALPVPLLVQFMEADKQLRTLPGFYTNMISSFDAVSAPNERYGIAHAVDQNCKVLIERFNVWKAVPGLNVWAAEQYQAPTGDLGAAIQNLIDQMTNYRTQYEANIGSMNETRWTQFRALLVNLSTAADITL